MRANNSLPLQWTHLESTRTLQNELQRETKRLRPQSQGGRADSAGEEKWGCRMNEFEVVHEKFCRTTCSVMETKCWRCYWKANAAEGTCCLEMALLGC
jgi:hypothetical protein